jgi:hypothetical protein
MNFSLFLVKFLQSEKLKKMQKSPKIFLHAELKIKISEKKE